MAVIFNDDGLKDINPPCVAQTFVNHNATLYKIFKVGSKQYIGHRPSLKNLYPGGMVTVTFLVSMETHTFHAPFGIVKKRFQNEFLD